MDYKLTKLKNNLRIISIPMPTLESATVTVWVKTGSRNEPDGKLGLSHFLEHMAFKGGKKYASARAVSEAIDGIGGEFNASTSKDYTNFYVRARAKNLPIAYDVLSDIVCDPMLKQEDINREKGVIIEEMNLYEDTPVRRIWDEFEQVIFENHPLGRDIIGTKKTVPSLKRTDFVDYRNRYYYGENMLITVAGSINQPEIMKLSQKHFGNLPKTGKGKTISKEPSKDKIRTSITSKSIEQAHMIVGFPADPLGGKMRYTDAVLDTILGSGMSSRLFSEIREKRGLAYTVKSTIERHIDAGYFAVYAGVDPKNGEEALKVVLDQLYGIADKKYKVSKKELEKAKEYLKGHLALSLEDTRGVNSFFGYEKLILNKTRTPEEVYDKVNKVSVEDVYASARKIFTPQKANLAIIGPYKSENKFVKLLN